MLLIIGAVLGFAVLTILAVVWRASEKHRTGALGVKPCGPASELRYLVRKP